MYFRLCYIVKPLNLGGKNQLVFNYKKQELVEVSISRIKETDSKNRYGKNDLICIAITQREGPPKTLARIESADTSNAHRIETFVNDLHQFLNDHVEQTLSVFRWMRGSSAPHSPIRFFKSFDWSKDRKRWKPIPTQLISMHIEWGFPIHNNLPQGFIMTVENMVNERTAEPLGHELFCEAWEQRTNNPRSSLVIGVAAAETGFKQCVADLIPEAKWLTEKVQSPPLIKMITEYLPTLPVRNKINGKIVLPPKKIIEALRKGVTIRNEVIHGQDTKVKAETIQDVLRAVRDLLYLLDYYRGYEWASNYISAETKKLLVKASGVQ